MVVRVTLDYEFYEVLNAFPMLFKYLTNDLKLSLNDVVEGESVDEFLDKKALSSDEKLVFLRRVNYKIKDFFSSESRMRSVFDDEDDSDEEESLEEE